MVDFNNDYPSLVRINLFRVPNKSYPIENSARIARHRVFVVKDYSVFWHFFDTIVAALTLVVAKACIFLMSTRILNTRFAHKARKHHIIRRILEQLEDKSVGELLSLRELNFRHDCILFFAETISRICPVKKGELFLVRQRGQIIGRLLIGRHCGNVYVSYDAVKVFMHWLNDNVVDVRWCASILENADFCYQWYSCGYRVWTITRLHVLWPSCFWCFTFNADGESCWFALWHMAHIIVSIFNTFVWVAFDKRSHGYLAKVECIFAIVEA